MTRARCTGFLALVAMLGVVGCPCTPMTKEECKTTYGLVEPSPAPIPGPIIIVKKDASGELEWSVDSGSGPVVQTAAADSAFSSSGNGKLRSDFFGTGIDEFTVEGGGTTYSNANYVVIQLEKDGSAYTIEMVRVAGDNVRWYLTKDGHREPLDATSSYAAGTVPKEFIGTVTSFREIVEDVDLDQIDPFRVDE